MVNKNVNMTYIEYALHVPEWEEKTRAPLPYAPNNNYNIKYPNLQCLSKTLGLDARLAKSTHQATKFERFN